MTDILIIVCAATIVSSLAGAVERRFAAARHTSERDLILRQHSAERQHLVNAITAQNVDPAAYSITTRLANARPKPATDERQPVVIPTDI